MMKLFSSKWNIFKIPLVQRALFHSSKAPSDSLFFRLSKAGGPTIHMNPILNQWVEEGRDVKYSDLQFSIKQLRAYRRFTHALQISEWMSNEMNLHMSSGDIAVRLDLIAKVYGLDPAEKYFDSILDSARDFKVYGALMNCYAQHNLVEKAEVIMQKIEEYASVYKINLLVNYNILIKLYARVGEYEKLDRLMQEMKDKDIYDNRTLNARLNAYATAKDIDGMEKFLLQMEVDPKAFTDWKTYITAANGYLKAGNFEKSYEMLKKSEKLISGKKQRVAYESLLTMYAATGKRDDVYRIWNLCRSLIKPCNSSYICMMTSLAKLNDIDGAERILQEWKSEKNTCLDFRIPNMMVTAYCMNGLLEKAEAYVVRLTNSGDGVGSLWDRLAFGYYKCNDMDTAVQKMKKAILIGHPRSQWKPLKIILAACIEHMKDKGDLELASEILRRCLQRGYLSADTYNRLLSYVRGEIPETNAINLMEDYYHLKTGEFLQMQRSSMKYYSRDSSATESHEIYPTLQKTEIIV